MGTTSVPSARRSALTEAPAERARVWSRPWVRGFVLVSLGLAALHLAALGTAPPGLYNDEASMGYNAWALANAGVDEHGVSWPLFFQAFNEWKGPVYIYTLAPLTRILPLTAYVTRLPAALSGLGICLVAALAAWRMTRSRKVTMAMLLTAGLEPWLVVESRLAFETIQMVLCLTVATWCLVEADRAGRGSWRWFAGAGVALGVAVYSYTPARLFSALVAAAVLVAWLALGPRRLSCLAVLPPLAAFYGSLELWGQAHPGVLTARFNILSVDFDHPGAAVVVSRAFGNYLDYLGFPFLFTHGDANIRHSTGFGGMLLVSTAPAVLTGLVVCARRWREALARFTLAGAALSPVPAALTVQATPHSLRAATMLPFILLLATYGWAFLLPRLARGGVLAIALAIAAAVEVGGYQYDLFTQWPGRSLMAFDAGEGAAIVRAHELAKGHPVLLSKGLDAPYIQAYFFLRPDPRAAAREGQAVLGMRDAGPPDLAAAAPGDVLVLAPDETPPLGSTLLDVESVVVTNPVVDVLRPSQQRVILATVWRR